jgi:branched-chain amino acid transport system permease protein
MTLFLFLEQLFNGAQFGVTLFLIAAGLTLILGIMDFVFLAHGAQVMIGAYLLVSCLPYRSPSLVDSFLSSS